MRCPICKKEFYPQPDALGTYWADDDSESITALRFSVQECPSCGQPLVVLETGDGIATENTIAMTDVTCTTIVYPQQDKRQVAPEVPEEYASDLLEAIAALDYSPKASAALSRRLLQKTLREELGITKRDLSQEIDEFINTSSAPTYLTDAVDAVRQIGNFAAHPIKSKSSSEIVEVEPGEAEWLIEVLDSLFDFTFVQPAKLTERRDALNEKLKELGKPELKGRKH